MKWIAFVFLCIMLSALVLGVDAESGIGVRFSVNNWTTSSDAKTNNWVCTEGQLYKTYGSPTDTWGLTGLKAVNFTNSTFQVAINLTERILTPVARADHIQIKLYYTTSPNISYVSPTPANNSVIGSTLRVNTTMQITPDDCKLQNNLVKQSIILNNSMEVSGTSCSITYRGLADTGTLRQIRAFANASGRINGTETRWYNVSNKPTTVILNSPANNTISSNVSWSLNWSVNNTQLDDVIIKGYISKNNTDNITKNIFFNRGDMQNGTYKYIFDAMLTPLDSQGLWALYRFENDTRIGETFTNIYDYTENNRNGTHLQWEYYETGKFGMGMNHSTTADDVRLNSGDFANISVNGMTINAWVNLSSNASFDTITSRYDTTGNDRFFIFQIESAKPVFYLYQTGSASPLCTTSQQGTIPLGEWSMVTAVWNDETNYTQTYINGVLNNQTSCSFDEINQANWQDAENVFIGSLGGASNEFHGVIDEVGFWNRTLSSTEISNLYNLQNDTYYWYVEADEYNTTRVNSTMFQFTIGGAVAVSNSCTYTSGNWNIAFEDNCTINENIVIDTGGNISLTGLGKFTLNANISNWNRIIIDGTELIINKGSRFVSSTFITNRRVLWR